VKAVVWHGVGDIRLDDAPEPKIQDPTDVIVRITTSAICGTDLHMVRGTMPGMKEGRILGHEAVGVVEEAGPDVRNLRPGDRVVVPSTIGCGYCSYCRSGYYAQCDNANPSGSGTAFFGGPEEAGGFDGLQAEYARIPYGNVGLVAVPDGVRDEQAILVSDIFPTGWFGAKLADIRRGDTVAVYGAGPVGLFAAVSAFELGAGRVLSVDGNSDRLQLAKSLHAEAINFNDEDPVEAVKRLTGGIGADRVIDAVGVDAEPPSDGPAASAIAERRGEFAEQLEQIGAAQTDQTQWRPGQAPGLALEWAVQSLAKAGTLAIIGVYPQTMKTFPIGAAMMTNLSINMGNCNHRKYLPTLLELVQTGRVDPTQILTQTGELPDAISAYETFDRREQGWTKVALTVG
jgi:threonine dehydrogenase-like Zn-dependent dehydrogenase